MRKIQPAKIDISKEVQSITRGGTSSENATDAAQKLFLVTNSMKNQINGIVGLDENKKISLNLFDVLENTNYVNIDGSFTIYTNQLVNFTITDYDAFRSYNLNASSGIISRSNEIISYTGPAIPGPVTMTINGRIFNFNILDAQPAQPSIVSPIDGSINQSASVTITSSTYQALGSSTTHASTDWQVSTSAAFSSFHQQSINDSVNKTTWIVSGLNTSTTYYIRCRYKDNNNKYSEWSVTSSFTTKASFYPSVEEAKLTANDKAASDFFGTNCGISDDGTRVVITALGSDPGGTNAAGAAYIFVRSGSTWTQEAKLFASDKVADDQFGFSADMDATGTRCIIGVKESDPGGTTGAGAAYIYVRSGTSWSQEQKLFASDKTTSDQFGFSVTIDTSGTRIAAGARAADAGATAGAGAVYIWTRSGTVWTQEQKIIASDASSNADFGNAVSFDENATRILIGAYTEDTAAANSGAAYVFLRTGVSWTQEQKLKLSSPVASDWFGYSVSISSTGLFAAISASLYEAEGLNNSGMVLVYKRTGTVWSLSASLTASDKAANNQFGYCVALNSDASILVVSTPVKTVSGITGAGCVYMFSRNTSTDVWTEQSIFSASDKAASDQFGYCLDIARNDNRVVTGANSSDPSGITSAGSAYIFA